jgi:hypothetical protein
MLGHYRYELPELSLRALTPEAAVHARARLGSEPLKLIFSKGAAKVKPDPSFRGLRVWATDGSAMSVPDSEHNEKAFGRLKAARGKTAFPKLHFVALVDATTRQVRDVVVGRHNQSEREAAVELLSHLGGGDLLLADRGFAAVWFFDICVNDHNVDVLIRIAKSWKPRIVKRLGRGDYLVEVTGKIPKQFRKKASPKAKRGPATTTMTMRMLEFTIGKNETVRLLTNLLDPVAYPAQELAELYHSRWECELVYDELKTHLAAVTEGSLDLAFRSKRPDGVMQELYALFSLYNIIRGMMADAAKLHDIAPLEISFVESVQLIRDAMPRYLAAPESKKATIYRQLLDDIAGCQNPRPRRKRQCPRAVKIKMSSYNLKGTARERVLDPTVSLK